MATLNEQADAVRPFPIGWSRKALPGWDAKDCWASLAGVLLWLCVKIPGLLWTGLALSLGAPFWFDLLQKFMNLRGAGGKPSEKKPKGATVT